MRKGIKILTYIVSTLLLVTIILPLTLSVLINIGAVQQAGYTTGTFKHLAGCLSNRTYYRSFLLLAETYYNDFFQLLGVIFQFNFHESFGHFHFFCLHTDKRDNQDSFVISLAMAACTSGWEGSAR